jgi:hypothetical protein
MRTPAFLHELCCYVLINSGVVCYNSNEIEISENVSAEVPHVIMEMIRFWMRAVHEIKFSPVLEDLVKKNPDLRKSVNMWSTKYKWPENERERRQSLINRCAYKRGKYSSDDWSLQVQLMSKMEDRAHTVDEKQALKKFRETRDRYD